MPKKSLRIVRKVYISAMKHFQKLKFETDIGNRISRRIANFEVLNPIHKKLRKLRA